MRIAIVGGQLQGLEAVYLAWQARFEVALIDKNPLAPARSLVGEFYQMDLMQEKDAARELFKTFDLILPATESYQTLTWLQEVASQCQVSLALDLPSYAVTSSKIVSNQLFERTGIPFPRNWPDCGFPVIVKPSNQSGSSGVMRIENDRGLREALAYLNGELIIQEYLDGPSYSLEVLAHSGQCVCFQITELAFDAGYDCKRVLAGPNTGNDVAEAFCDLGERIALALPLSGIMDVEVILTADGLKVLEIDARLPSQTPTAVYHSTGVNLLELLVRYWTEGKLPPYRRLSGRRKAVIYEHFRFKNGVLQIAGEHILRDAHGLRLHQNRFSAHVVISNFETSPEDWVATCIFEGETESQVWELHDRAVKEIQKEFKCGSFLDPAPSQVGSLATGPRPL